MKIRLLLLCFCVFLLCGCPTFKNEMGVQQIANQHIPQTSMVQIYNVLKQELPNYTIELVPVPEDSTFMVIPEWGRAHVESHHYIGMRSSANDILIQYHVMPSNKKSPFVEIRISYYLNGENSHNRLDELNEPMNKIKKILIDKFPEKIKEEDFTERFLPRPRY